MNSQQPPYPASGVYEHFKSTPEDRRYYQVLGVAQHTETSEVLVVYIALHATYPGLRLKVRPLTMFTDMVEHNGTTVPRFRYLGPELSATN